MAKIYNDFQPANLMSFAKSFARLNGQPLDKSEIWYDLAEAQAYAATEAAYVGQILAVIDKENSTVHFYGIQDAEGTLIEIGSDIAANVDELAQNIEEISNILDELILEIGDAADDENPATGIYKELEDILDVIDTKADADNVYTKEETDEAIAVAIATVDHLSRVIVDSVDDIDVDAENADLFIYMVPTGFQYEDDKYDEYVVINGVIEKVGSWEVDLSNYATKEEVNNLSKTISDNKDELDEEILNLQKDLADEIERAKAAESANASEIEKKADKATTLAGYGITDAYTKSEITDLISDITGGESAADVKAELTEFKTTTNNTLQTIQTDLNALKGAEPNYIKSVDAENFSVEDGNLSLKSIEISQVDGLQDIVTNNTVTAEEKSALQNIVAGKYDNYIKSTTSDFEVSQEGQLKLVNVSKDALKAVVGDVTTLIDYTEETTIVSEINNIKQLLIWQEMTVESNN